MAATIDGMMPGAINVVTATWLQRYLPTGHSFDIARIVTAALQINGDDYAAEGELVRLERERI